MEGFTENDFKILKSIIDRGDNKKGLTIASGTSIQDIVSKTNLSSKKVRDTIKKCVELGYVQEGLSRVRTKTYILTTNGLAVLKLAKINIIGEEIRNE